MRCDDLRMFAPSADLPAFVRSFEHQKRIVRLHQTPISSHDLLCADFPGSTIARVRTGEGTYSCVRSKKANAQGPRLPTCRVRSSLHEGFRGRRDPARNCRSQIEIPRGRSAHQRILADHPKRRALACDSPPQTACLRRKFDATPRQRLPQGWVIWAPSGNGTVTGHRERRPLRGRIRAGI